MSLRATGERCELSDEFPTQHVRLRTNRRRADCRSRERGILDEDLERLREKLSQGPPGVGIVELLPSDLDEFDEPGCDESLGQRLGRGKVTVDSTDADLGTPRNRIQLERLATRTQFARRSQDEIAIAGCVTTERRHLPSLATESDSASNRIVHPFSGTVAA